MADAPAASVAALTHMPGSLLLAVAYWPPRPAARPQPVAMGHQGAGRQVRGDVAATQILMAAGMAGMLWPRAALPMGLAMAGGAAMADLPADPDVMTWPADKRCWPRMLCKRTVPECTRKVFATLSAGDLE